MPLTADPLRILPSDEPPPAVRLDGITVLVVDDHDDGRMLYQDQVCKPARAEELAQAVAALSAVGRAGPRHPARLQ